MKKLPIGIQSFRKLRNDDCLYVDKTEQIYRLLHTGNCFFLSRPRRFGKSLLLSTMEEIFSGNKALFEGLYIYDKIDWTQYPVIKLDFGKMAYGTPDELKTSLKFHMDNISTKNGIILTGENLADRFSELIERLHLLSGCRTVVLIDEYDKSIVDHLDNLPVANANRDILRSFYQVLKAADEHLRFVFLTGVSKFSKVSVFSGLNNLNDITLDARYATICGYTQEELETNFTEHLSELMQAKRMNKEAALARIKSYYDGYSWDGLTSVYNPFSTLLLFDKNEFIGYWFATGTPTFLIKILKNTDLTPVLKPVTMGASGFDSFDPANIAVLPLLFQTGYLTIKNIEENIVSEELDYTLGIPNGEVHNALLSGLLAEYSGYSVGETGALKGLMQKQLIEGDEEGFNKSMKRMFAHIPYQLHIPSEAYYHSLFLLWLKLLGFEVQGELSTDKGRIDAVWLWRDRAVIAEIKYKPDEKGPDTVTKLLDQAMAQIEEMKYFERYAGQYQVTLLAVALAGKETGCKIKRV